MLNLWFLSFYAHIVCFQSASDCEWPSMVQFRSNEVFGLPPYFVRGPLAILAPDSLGVLH